MDVRVPPHSAVALLSGGLDSAIALAKARHEMRIVLALTFDYGQKAAFRELERSARIAATYDIPFRSIRLPWFSEMAGALIGPEPVPRLGLEQLDDLGVTRQTARAVWVPNRNGVFIEIAAGIAESIGADRVVVGFNKEEAATFPDNGDAYVRAVNNALGYSTANGVRVVAPTGSLSKAGIVAEAICLGFPLGLLWSCYESGERMCGKCESCGRLRRALAENGAAAEVAFAD